MGSPTDVLYRWVVGAAMRALGAHAIRFRAGDSVLKVWRLGPPHGEPWVLLHGLGSSALAWGPLVKRFLAVDGGRRPTGPEGRRFIVPELSARGGSQVPGGWLAVLDGVPLVAELIRQQFPGRPAVVAGNSLGGWLALRLAIAHPELVSRLVLLSPAGYRDQDWDRIERAIRVADLASAEELVERMFARPPVPKRLLRHAFRHTFTSDGVAAAIDKLEQTDALDDDDLARIDVPTALVWGEHDGIFEIECADRMAAALPHPRVYRLASAGHIPHWEDPEAVGAAIEDFCRRPPETAD